MNREFAKIFLENNYTEGKRGVVKITETSLNRINYHLKNSNFIVISAFTPFTNNSENLKRTEKLKDEIRKRKLSYIPVYGGYKMKDTGEMSYETSFIVLDSPPNTIPEKKQVTAEELRKIGLELIQYPDGQTSEGFEENAEKIDVNQFGQEAFLFKEIDKPAYFVYQDNSESLAGNAVKFNDVAQEYFTGINKRNYGTKSDKFFSLAESYMNRPARTIMEGMGRSWCGEVFEQLTGGR